MSDNEVDSDEEFFQGELEEDYEEEVPRGNFQTHGSGLIGAIAGEKAVYFIVFNKNDIKDIYSPQNYVSVVLRPRVNRMKFIGSTVEIPEKLECEYTLVNSVSNSPNITIKVSYCSTFAALYQHVIEAIGTSKTLADIRIESRGTEAEGCIVKGAGIRGGVSEIPSSFRVQASDRYLNFTKTGGEDFQAEISRDQIKGQVKSSKIPTILIDDQNDGSYIATYTPPISGQYTISIFFNNIHINGSPFKSIVVPGTQEIERAKLRKIRRRKMKELEASGALSPSPTKYTPPTVTTNVTTTVTSTPTFTYLPSSSSSTPTQSSTSQASQVPTSQLPSVPTSSTANQNIQNFTTINTTISKPYQPSSTTTTTSQSFSNNTLPSTPNAPYVNPFPSLQKATVTAPQPTNVAPPLLHTQPLQQPSSFQPLTTPSYQPPFQTINSYTPQSSSSFNNPSTYQPPFHQPQSTSFQPLTTPTYQPPFQTINSYTPQSSSSFSSFASSQTSSKPQPPSFSPLPSFTPITQSAPPSTFQPLVSALHNNQTPTSPMMMSNNFSSFPISQSFQGFPTTTATTNNTNPSTSTSNYLSPKQPHVTSQQSGKPLPSFFTQINTPSTSTSTSTSISTPFSSTSTPTSSSSTSFSNRSSSYNANPIISNFPSATPTSSSSSSATSNNFSIYTSFPPNTSPSPSTTAATNNGAKSAATTGGVGIAGVGVTPPSSSFTTFMNSRYQIDIERQERDRLERERSEKERVRHEMERIEKEKQERERLERQRIERDRIERERFEKERQMRAQQQEQDRLERARIERLRIEKEKWELEQAEKARREREHAERERLLKLEWERLERERLERERAERQLLEIALERERIERERVELARQQEAEKLRKDQERLERDRIERERFEREQAEIERIAKEKLVQEQAEKARIERERLERERQEVLRREAERIEHERQEILRLEHEKQERIRAEKERMKLEQLLKEKERNAKEEEERKELQRLKKDPALQPLLEKSSAVLRFQSIIRSHNTSVEIEKLRKQFVTRSKVAAEIVSTEENYVKNLQLLIDAYSNPLRTHSWISMEEHAKIFANVEYIVYVNLSLRDKLQQSLAASPWAMMGHVFLSTSSEFKHTYSIYVNNYEQSLEMIDKLQSSNSKWRHFLEKTKEATGVDLMSLLITPVQRLPRYELLLKELFKHTPSDCRDFAQIHAAINDIKEVNKYINERKRTVERLHKLLKIQNRIYGDKSPLFEMDSNREFINKSNLEIVLNNKKATTRHVLLFNDSLMITKKKLLRRSQNLQFRFRFNFDRMKIIIPNENSLQLSERGITITLISNKYPEFFEQVKKSIISFNKT